MCVFLVDSMLVAEQLNGNYACRSEDLQDTYSKCVSILEDLTNRGQPWQIRHIYREYNATADALPGRGPPRNCSDRVGDGNQDRGRETIIILFAVQTS